jgi:hypothetical protein
MRCMSGRIGEEHGKKDSMIEHRERLLDEALKQSFPASDPPSIVSAPDPSANVNLQQCWRQSGLDKDGISSISKDMSERSHIGRPQLHPGSSTARF